MEQNLCVLCQQFCGNPDFNMCSVCYKKSTPDDQLTPEMRAQKEKQKQKQFEQSIQNYKNQERQDELSQWAEENDRYPITLNRKQKLEELKALIINDKNSRPFLAYDFLAKSSLWLTTEESLELIQLATGSWIAYHVFFSRCIDLYKIKEGIVQLDTTGGAAGYYAEYKRGQMTCPFINNLSNEELMCFGGPEKVPEDTSNCQLCGSYQPNSKCFVWGHGVQNPQGIDWTGYKQLNIQ